MTAGVLAEGARAARCRPLQEGRRLRAGLVSCYPDAMVVLRSVLSTSYGDLNVDARYAAVDAVATRQTE